VALLWLLAGCGAAAEPADPVSLFEGRTLAGWDVQEGSERLPGSHEVTGYQVDAGDEWWGKLYDESRRDRVIAETADLATIAAAVVPANSVESSLTAADLQANLDVGKPLD
jgi:hypothetical protein